MVNDIYSGNPIEDLPTLLNDTLAVYGGGPAEPIDLPTFEVPGPYTENVEVNQINGCILRIAPHFIQLKHKNFVSTTCWGLMSRVSILVKQSDKPRRM